MSDLYKIKHGEIVRGEELAKKVVDATVKRYPLHFRLATEHEKVVDEKRQYLWVDTSYVSIGTTHISGVVLFGYEAFDPIDRFEDTVIGKRLEEEKRTRIQDREAKKKMKLEKQKKQQK